ncbi:MLP-like protein 423 [Primulina huaijiensis]|uniref:MLP-like protein 423 n=1 Tax=Primulina huaijiensis TaxID=1492673 RepID=UPI003CC76C0D
MMASTFSVEVEMKSNPEKVWDWVYNFTICAPREFPQVFTSVEVREGDGNNAGTVRLIKYPQGSPIANLAEKLEVVDEDNKTINYTFAGGDVLNFYKSFNGTVTVSPLKGDGTLLKYYGKFQRVNEENPIPESIEEFLNFGLRALDNHLFKQK